MVATVETIAADVEFLKAQHKTLCDAAIPLIDKQKDLLARYAGAAPGAELKSVSMELQKRAADVTQLRDITTAITKRLDDIKLGLIETGGAGPRGEKKWKSIKEAWGLTPSVPMFLAEAIKGSQGLRNSGSIHIGSWFRKGIDYTPGRVKQKGTDLLTTTSPIVTPRYFEDILERPRQVSVLRQLIGSTPTPGTNTAIMYREATDPSPGASLTANIIATATSAVLTNVTGLTTVAPFATVTFTEGALTESVTVLTVVAATKTITFAATTNAYTTAALVEYTAIQQTPEGVLKPCITGNLEAYQVAIVTLALTRRVSNQALKNIVGLQQYLESAGPELLSEMEAINFWYGNGTTGSSAAGIMGLMKDTEILAGALAAWSTFPTGTTIFGYLIEGMYALAGRGVASRTAVLSVARHKELAQLTGDDGHYVWTAESPAGVPREAFVGELYWDNFLSTNDIMMGDFQLGARILDAEVARTDFGLDGNDFSENMITTRFEEEVGLAIPSPQYLIKMVADAAPA